MHLDLEIFHYSLSIFFKFVYYSHVLKKFIKRLIFYEFLIKIRNFFLKILLKIHINFKSKNNLKIVIGASKTRYNDWISTNINTLNITLFNDWKFLFNYNSLSNILAEHVFEHLTLSDVKITCQNCHLFLKKGGTLRIAVPDGFFPNKNYIESVMPGGSGPGADDHKQLYNFNSIKEIFDLTMFDYELIEFFDHNGKFNCQLLDESKGFIIRSRNNDERNTPSKIYYTSLIIDLIKK